MHVLPEDVDDSQGTGSRSTIDDEKMKDEWETRDQRADTHTTFFEQDIDKLNVSAEKKRRLKRILRLQEGEQVNSDEYDSRGQQNHKEDKRRLIGTFTAQLGLTQHQKSRVRHIVMDVIEVNSYGNYSMEEVILGVITYVCMEDMSDNGVHVDDRETFHQLADSVDTSMERVRGARQITTRRLSG